MLTSDETFVYAYDKRMCYFDALIEHVLINLYAFVGTNMERNPEHANTFNSAPLHVRMRNTRTVITRVRLLHAYGYYTRTVIIRVRLLYAYGYYTRTVIIRVRKYKLAILRLPMRTSPNTGAHLSTFGSFLRSLFITFASTKVLK